jgi:hypothetical protein
VIQKGVQRDTGLIASPRPSLHPLPLGSNTVFCQASLIEQVPKAGPDIWGRLSWDLHQKQHQVTEQHSL